MAWRASAPALSAPHSRPLYRNIQKKSVVAIKVRVFCDTPAFCELHLFEGEAVKLDFFLVPFVTSSFLRGFTSCEETRAAFQNLASRLPRQHYWALEAAYLGIITLPKINQGFTTNKIWNVVIVVKPYAQMNHVFASPWYL